MTDNGTGLAGLSNEGEWNGHTAGMRARKGSVYDGGVRVPFCVQWPAANVGGGRDVNRLAAGIDVIPTLVEFDGRSLTPLLRDEPGWAEGRIRFTQHTQFYVQGKRQMYDPQPYLRSAVLDERWGLIDGKEVYDSRADAVQANYVAAQQPQEVARLRAAYDEWWAQVTGPAHEYFEFPIGADGGNPARLTSFDWPPDGGPPN